MSTTVTIRLEPELKDRLDRLAQATDRSRSFLAAAAVRDYVELNEWQIQEIQSALGEAEKGEFASDSDVEKTLKKWEIGAD